MKLEDVVLDYYIYNSMDYLKYFNDFSDRVNHPFFR